VNPGVEGVDGVTGLREEVTEGKEKLKADVADAGGVNLEVSEEFSLLRCRLLLMSEAVVVKLTAEEGVEEAEDEDVENK